MIEKWKRSDFSFSFNPKNLTMKQIFLLPILAILFSTPLYAQDVIRISGNVQDDRKQGLEGVTVVVKGTTVGIATDAAGNYTLEVSKTDKTLVFSFIGFESKEIAINPNQGNYVVNVNLAAADVGLNQVVVSASKKNEKILDAPASVSVLGQEKLERNIVTTPVEQLKTTPGVDVIRSGLVSANVVVRGFNNIFSGSVLNVVDNRIGSVPSLRVNAYQLVPTSNLDMARIEVVRGPASALYGPNASSGVIHIITKSPLDQVKKFETTVAMTSGFTVLDKSYRQFEGGKRVSGNIINPEFRHSGKLWDGKFGYKISGSYFQGRDYPNYDPREPFDGDSVVFGSVANGQIFKPDTVRFVQVTDSLGNTTMVPELDIQRFKKDFNIQKYAADARIDIRPINDITITLNGGLASARNIELTGLGAASAGGSSGSWIYWYFQTRFRWKNLYVQYFINSSNAGNTFLIPQLSASARNDYDASNPKNPYQVQKLIDKSQLHTVQVQHSWNPIEKLGFIYGVDVLATIPNTEGSINGRFENRDNMIQAGGYLQGEYEPLHWLKFVAAFRADYNSIIKKVAASPRAAVVFKPHVAHSIRLTYNRAFDSPNTLNQFLDLSNGLIPNGINIRGIGNPYGWQYNYDANGNVQFKTAPWNSPSGQWVTFGDNSLNAPTFDSLTRSVINTFAGALGGGSTSELIATGLVNQVFSGIRGEGGSVENAEQISIDYANFATTKDLAGSKQNVANFKDLARINNSYTQTLELGYKGLLFNKLSIQFDAYWTRISQYVSPLLSASGAVMLDHQSYLGDFDTTGRLYQNLYANGGAINSTLVPLLDGNPSLQNASIVAPIAGSVWDEFVVLTYQFPMGTITPNDSGLVGSDYILTYKNLGRLDVFGLDFGFQYNIYDDAAHNISAGGSFSWVNKDQIRLSSGETISLNAPRLKASASFDHLIKKVGFGYGFNLRYQNAYEANSSIYNGDVKPAYLLDARVSYRPNFYKNLMLSINVNNVTNYQWQSFPGTPIMGAQFFARAQVTF